MLLMATVAVAFVSCDKDKAEEPKAPVIKAAGTAVEAAHQGGSYKISYSVENPVEGESLKAETATAWIENIAVSAGEVSFDVQANTSGAAREGAITLSYKGAQNVSVSVSQLYNPAEIKLSADKTECDYKGGEFSFNATVENATDGTELEVSAKDEWITDLKNESGKISFKVAENNSGAARSGKIELKYGESSVNHTVEQSFAAAEIKVENPGTYSAEGGNMSISYTIENPRQDAKAEASCEDAWLENIKVEDGKITFSLSENGDAERNTVLKLSYPTAEDKSIEIRQEGVSYTSENLSADGTANSYIVSAAGEYRFSTVKGNSSESVGEISSAEVLWESFGTDTAPQEGDLVANTRLLGKFIEFTVPQPYKEGNAVIAAKDAAGNILWSWHIWLTDKPADQVYNNNAGTVMDRNLGATSATPGDVGALGLLYQWGRKDPFLSSSHITQKIPAVSTGVWPEPVISSAETGTIDYAIQNPMTVIMMTEEDTNNDWYYTGNETTDDTRWQSNKTIHDPCPAGYRVPDGGEQGLWAKAFGQTDKFNGSFDTANAGFDFGSASGNPSLTADAQCWYPAAGYISSFTGKLDFRGLAWYSSVTPDGKYAFGLFFRQYNDITPVKTSLRVSGESVRCVKE